MWAIYMPNCIYSVNESLHLHFFICLETVLTDTINVSLG